MNTTFDTTEQEKAAARLRWDFHAKIVDRAFSQIESLQYQTRIKRSTLLMDLDSIPELDLPRLLEAPAEDFNHDICGILRNMDRSTYPGKLTGCFWPRCARQDVGLNAEFGVIE